MDRLPSLAIIGAQWGDEGKGKITDYLAEDADVVARFQGGNNAGHTIRIGDETFKLHLLPSGILRKGKTAVIGNGVVVNMEDMMDEIDQVESSGRDVSGLRISDRAHLIMDHHKRLDGAEEAYRGDRTVGTTGRGIGPAYQDKIARSGFRAGDILETEGLEERVRSSLRFKEDLLGMMGVAYECDIGTLMKRMEGWKERFGRYICDTSVLLNDALDRNERVLFEGAQGVMLDIDHGTYPFVTSSNTSSGGICTGSGVAPNRIGTVVGCLKAYTTRVGEGPLVTELHGKEGEDLMRKGGEFGTTTGRGRRCGWLDLVVAEHAVRLCGMTSLAITKLDVLSGYKRLKVCTGYEIDGRVEKHFPSSLSRIRRAVPVYEEMDGWDPWDPSEDIASRGYEALPENMRSYVKFIEDSLKVPADIISIGPKRSETIDRRKDWWN